MLTYWLKVAVDTVELDINSRLKTKAVKNLSSFIIRYMGANPTYGKIEYLAVKWLNNVYLA